MRFEWNEPKNRKNFKKHGIPFETAALVFDDPHALNEQDRMVEDEERWQTIGRHWCADPIGGPHLVR
jgi:hypothetical protein